MRRIVNILAKMVSAIVLALIFLPLLVALLFEIPAVQNFVAREATEIISRKLGTRISIDRVDIGLFYRVSLDGFYVEDFQRDTLLYAGRLDARIKSLGLFGGGLVFSRAELSDARFCLRETPDGEMNIKQVVDKLSKKDKARAEGKFRLEIERLETDGLDFCMERLEHRNPSYGVDFADMHLIDIRAELKNFTIDGPVIHTDIGRLAMRERSGFVVEDLAGCLCIANGCIDIREGHGEVEYRVAFAFIDWIGLGPLQKFRRGGGHHGAGRQYDAVVRRHRLFLAQNEGLAPDADRRER